METWADLARRLEAAGASEETVQAIRRATAGSRHACRVRIARDSAIEAAREHLRVHPRVEGGKVESEEELAALLLAIELNGAGGPGGLGGAGCATERMPPFRTWGRGRRHAADGAAWDAAAREALRGLARPTHVGYDVRLRPARVHALALTREIVPGRFALAIARASLLAVIEADVEGRHAAVLDVGEVSGDLPVEVAGTAAEWAAVCTKIEGLAG